MVPDLELTAEQEAEAQLIYAQLMEKVEAETLAMARLLASKQTADLLGETEYQVRDGSHRIAASALESALAVRKKNLPG